MPLPQYGNWRDRSHFPLEKNEQVGNPAPSNPNPESSSLWHHPWGPPHPLDDEPKKTFHTLWDGDSEHQGVLHPMVG